MDGALCIVYVNCKVCLFFKKMIFKYTIALKISFKLYNIQLYEMLQSPN